MDDIARAIAAIRAERAGKAVEPTTPTRRPTRAKAVRPRGGGSDSSGLKALAGRYNALRARRGADDPGTVAARLAWRQAGALDAVEQWGERELTDDERAVILAVLWPDRVADGVTRAAGGVTSPSTG